MANVAIEQTNGGIPAQLQLLILHCLSAALNQTQNTAIGIPDSNKKRITLSVDTDIFDKDVKEKLLEVENNLSNKIQEFKSAVIEELRKSSCKSEELLPELISNISNISIKNQELLATSIRENGQLSKRNEELLTQNNQGLQKALMEENSRLMDSNKDLREILENLTIANRDLEGEVHELQDKILKQTTTNHELQLNVVDQQGQINEATKNIHNLNESLHTLTRKYSNLKESIGISDLPVNVCKIQPNSVLGKLVHKYPHGQTPSSGTVWKPSLAEERIGKMQLQYSSTQDKYFRAVEKQEISGWENGVYKQNQFFRMVENDFKTAYLARNVGVPEGSISWKFDVSDIGQSIDNVRLIFTTALFFHGIVEASICSIAACTPIPEGNGVFETRDFQGVSQLEIIAKTRSGTGEAAWQHAQLFRQLLSDTTGYGFDVTITFRKCDLTLL